MLLQLAPTDNAVAVDNKHRTLAHTVLLAPHTKLLGDRAFGMEIGKQGKGEAAEVLGPRPMRVHAVYTDAQNLSVRRLEARMVALESRDLNLSATREVKHIEG